MKYRIIEQEFEDGGKRYVLESDETGEWKSVFASTHLDLIREAKTNRERSNQLRSSKVID